MSEWWKKKEDFLHGMIQSDRLAFDPEANRSTLGISWNAVAPAV